MTEEIETVRTHGGRQFAMPFWRPCCRVIHCDCKACGRLFCSRCEGSTDMTELCDPCWAQATGDDE